MTSRLLMVLTPYRIVSDLIPENSLNGRPPQSIMIIQIDPMTIPYDTLIQGLCKTPFYGHSKGCPNHGKKEGCPPQKMIDSVFDMEKEMYIIATEYPLGEFAERMRKEHFFL